MLRSGAQWRLLPDDDSKWNSVYKGLLQRCEAGAWERMFEHFADDPDMENAMIDSMIVHAHRCAAGAQALGRSHGALSSKIYVLVDGLGNLLRSD